VDTLVEYLESDEPEPVLDFDREVIPERLDMILTAANEAGVL
jgi:hypothetical protein